MKEGYPKKNGVNNTPVTKPPAPPKAQGMGVYKRDKSSDRLLLEALLKNACVIDPLFISFKFSIGGELGQQLIEIKEQIQKEQKKA